MAQCSAREESSSRLCVAGSGTNRESTVSENRQGLPASTPSLLGGRAPPDPPPPLHFGGVGMLDGAGMLCQSQPLNVCLASDVTAAQCLLGVKRHSRSMSAWRQTSQPLNVRAGGGCLACQRSSIPQSLSVKDVCGGGGGGGVRCAGRFTRSNSTVYALKLSSRRRDIFHHARGQVCGPVYALKRPRDWSRGRAADGPSDYMMRLLDEVGGHGRVET